MASQLIFVENATAPDTPTTGKLKVYAKTDGFLYFKNDAGTETQIQGTAAITDLTGDVTATGPGSAAATVAFVGGESASDIATSVNDTQAATNSNSPSTIVKRDGSGNFSAGTITANLSGNATNFTGSLSGEVSGTQSTTAISNAAVIGKVLTGFSSGSGTVSATDSIKTAIDKLDGNTALRALKSGDTFTGNVVLDNQKALRFAEDNANGTEFVGIRAPSALSASYTMQLPSAQAVGALTNDGSGNLSFVAASLSGFTTDDLSEGATNKYFTDERAQDAIGTILTDSTTVDFTYNDAGNTITADVIQSGIDHGSISGLGDDDHTQYHTDARALTWLGTRSTSDLSEGTNLYYTDERAQDAVGNILTDSSKIDFTYNDGAPSITATIVAGSIDNADINASAAIAYSKLALTNSILNADINAAAAIAYSKLALADSIVNADINTSAAIAYSKLALTGAIVNADIASAAAIAYSKLSLTGNIINADINAAAAIAYSKLNLAASIVNADINASAAIAYSKLSLSNSIVNADINSAAAIALSKLASLTASRALVTDGSGVITVATTTATEIGFVNGVTSAIQTQIDSKVAKAGDTMTGNLIMDNQKEVRFRETTANGTNYAAIKAPASLAADYTLTLPIDDGNANERLVTDGSGVLSWVAPTANIVQQSVSGNVTITTDNRDLILLVSTAAARSITFPAPASNSSRRITVKDITGSCETNNITMVRNGSEKIENVTASKVLSANYGAWTFYSDGTDWWML